MTPRSTRVLVALALAASVSPSISCKKTPTQPSPVEVVENFSGTLPPGGFKSHPFNVNYLYYGTDAFFTITSLTSAADGSAKTNTVGVGYGTINVGVCTRALSNPNVTPGIEVPTTGGTFGPGTYCIQIYDNPDAPTVTEPLNYTLKVRHD